MSSRLQKAFTPPHPKDPQRSRFLIEEYTKSIISIIKLIKKQVRNLVKTLKPKEIEFIIFQTPQERIDARIEAILSGMDPLMRSMAEKSMRTMWQRGRQQAIQQLTGLGIPQPSPVIPIDHVRRRKMLQNINVSLIRTIAQQYLNRIKNAVARYMIGDFTYFQLVRIIQNLGRTSTGRAYPEWMAHRIAKTEVTRALSISKGRTFLQAGVIYWQWITALDERVCPICRPLHGRVVKIGRPFGRWRRRGRPDVPINRPPAHPNCRCGIMPSAQGVRITPIEITRMAELRW